MIDIMSSLIGFFAINYCSYLKPTLLKIYIIYCKGQYKEWQGGFILIIDYVII